MTGAWAAGMRAVFVTFLLLTTACGSSSAEPSTPSEVASADVHVPRDAAERYARSLAKAVWTDLHRLPKEQAVANIQSQLQAFSDITGCSITASRRGEHSAAGRGSVHAVYRSISVAVTCP
jgi:hypothetical protein